MGIVKEDSRSERLRPRPISFNVSVTEADWDSEMGGWRLTALRLPGVRVDGIYVEGQKTDPGRFGVDSQQELLRWMPDPRPSRARIAVTITEELTTQKESDLQIESWRVSAERWKSLAAICTALMAVVAPGATLMVQHLGGRSDAVAHVATSLHSAMPIDLPPAPVAPSIPASPSLSAASGGAPSNSVQPISAALASPPAAHTTTTSRSNMPPPSPVTPGRARTAEVQQVGQVNIERCFDGTPGTGTVSVSFQKDGSAAVSVTGAMSQTEGDCVGRLFRGLRVDPNLASGKAIQRSIRFGGSESAADPRGGA